MLENLIILSVLHVTSGTLQQLDCDEDIHISMCGSLKSVIQISRDSATNELGC